MFTKIGDGKIVEIYDSPLVKRKYEKGRLFKNSGFLEILSKERMVENIFIGKVENGTESTSLQIIQRIIKPYKRIIRDGWKAYSKLDEYGYKREVFINEDNFVDMFLPYVHT
ncbi:hypothetical protein RF11_01077 [Thelohanellus kitauei]|uniref:Uncharacterized protein n=1 Tax=Thelohanellus kitauei TaxID=669202 RepID=A0A0C2N4B1_THEKT|nr:hypothetical protein RF11_01077 [Thelohanellus kitauei]